MTEITELSELRPAPRTTPAPVLWLMAVVVVVGGGAALLGWELDRSPAGQGSAVATQAAAPIMAGPDKPTHGLAHATH